MVYTIKKIQRIISELEKYIYPDSESVEQYKIIKGRHEFEEIKKMSISKWKNFNKGDFWGGKNLDYWFMTQIIIPERFNNKCVVFRIRTGRESQSHILNPQFLVYINGEISQGMDTRHCETILTESAAGGESFTLLLQAFSGMNEGKAELDSNISVYERAVEKLFYDIKVPFEASKYLKSDDKRKTDIISFMDRAVNMLDIRKPGSDCFKKTVNEASEFLDNEFYGKYCRNEDVEAVCLGHTHIDIAWKWTMSRTRDKVIRSFSTALNLIERYPQLIYMSGQPVLYKFIKEDYPAIYEKIKDKIKKGIWEAEGAMWLEADTNLPSGESLIRQIMFGKRFFMEEFGVDSVIFWAPDIFGFNASLPQILKKTGIKYFMANKLSWNEYNQMPYDTFLWRGIDGSKVFSYFLTTNYYEEVDKISKTRYNGVLEPSMVMGAWKRYSQKDLNNRVLLLYGWADGGGGPTTEMMENAVRMEKGIPGCPVVRHDTALNFFRELEETVKGNKKLPVWYGELYFEFHRGTYTSMARNKKFNRKSEFLYQDAELFSIINFISFNKRKYPQKKLNLGWEKLLINQFHDILPGTSIKEVYEDTEKDYRTITDTGLSVLETALSEIAGSIHLDKKSLVVFNQSGFARSDVVEMSLTEDYKPEDSGYVQILHPNGKALPVQISGGYEPKVVFYVNDIPSKGYRSFILDQKSKSGPVPVPEKDKMKINCERLENKFFIVTLDKNGNITSIWDKHNRREVIKKGSKANVLQAFEDKPYDFDAWDISIYYREKMWEVSDIQSMKVIEQGPVRAALRIKRNFLDSVIIQDICIYNDIARIDFKTQIEWREKQILLKAAFPVDINTENATYDIQFGNIERPVHWNTSWDKAKFEVYAHKWVDVSENGYGVSLLNDCKYGHDIKDNNIRITLLKSPVFPNENADRGNHEFIYSLYPHANGWREGGTIEMGYSLNCPFYTVVEEAHEGCMSSEFSFVNIDCENVMIETVKKSEDEDYVIIRVYESFNRRTAATVTLFNAPKKVWECNMLENNLSKIDIQDKSFKFNIMPYEIKTFKISFN